MLDMYLYAVCLTVVARLFADVVLPRQAKDGQKEEQKRKQAPIYLWHEVVTVDMVEEIPGSVAIW